MRLVAALLFVAAAARGATIAEAVTAATTTPPFDSAIWFVLVEDAQGHAIYELNARKLAIPASVRKLFSASSIAQCLGMDSRLRTELWLDGEDVVLQGGGDPSFGSDRYGVSPEESALNPFIRALRARDVRAIRDVVADVSLFDRVTIPYQWKVGNITSDVAAPVDALIWSENDIGSYAVASGGHFAALAFRDALLAAGITVTGRIRLETERRAWREHVATIRSPFMHQLLATVLKPSHNLFAEVLYKSTSTSGEQPASYEKARELEREFLLEAVGASESSFRFVDGSGLAPDNLVTAQTITKMLRWMNEPVRRHLYWDLLAEPGAEEGTLRSRLQPLADRVRAKTGTVAGVNALAGIIAGRNGGYRYFSITVNHHLGTSAAANRLIDAVVEAAAEF